VAAGYNDGSIRLFDPWTGECEVTFTGHKTAVISLAFDRPGLRLVSGSRDTNIVVWDIVAESGLYRLHGHKVVVNVCENFFLRKSLSS
jgi:U3 small nucleolar RNA-associated protein 12